MTSHRYEKGVHPIAPGCFAYLQPYGGWGLSNAGLVASRGEALLIDTLFDLRHTHEMLAAMRAAEPAATRIGTVVNTHANGDHCYGNQLVEGATIIASRASAAELEAIPAAALADLMRRARAAGDEYLVRSFEAFEFEGIVHTPPTRTFDGELRLSVGDEEVRLIEVGPAHTDGDVIVHVPGRHVVYTGDILFIGGTPLMWAGPIDNWIRACDLIISMDVEAIVPGHGPITDAAGVRAMRDYLIYVRDETRRCYEAGMSTREAFTALAQGPYMDLPESERIVTNVHAMYRELSGGRIVPPGWDQMFREMGEVVRRRAAGSLEGAGRSEHA